MQVQILGHSKTIIMKKKKKTIIMSGASLIPFLSLSLPVCKEKGNG